eukprot:4724961-Pyramimonas_sp.AAC.1
MECRTTTSTPSEKVPVWYGVLAAIVRADGRRLDGRCVRRTKKLKPKHDQLHKLRERKHGRLIMDDIADGRERVIIPVFNDVDDTFPPEFTYVR